jgi:copper chaperone CopZ
MIAFEVNDMTCGRCVSAITQAVKRVTPLPRCRSISNKARRDQCFGG